ncbi:DNA glycosylase [Lentinula lateritia]|uniref:DNA glycosylase n=1 Tax=Lentinula lateritia TaxID=40482 RepID=A0ABQ8V890_9AGAR|nr:DNA glycosylase [Lentinula lateritia]
MPWRKPHDVNLDMKERAQRAYEVWVSEVVVQQTQVATVIPYYNAWMKKFPTVADLAESSLDEVNALWKGLGYYSRASCLLAAAQIFVRDYQGRLPNNAKCQRLVLVTGVTRRHTQENLRGRNDKRGKQSSGLNQVE